MSVPAPDHHAVTKYAIACDGQPVPTYTVVYLPTQENLSHHETAHDARKARDRYGAADRRRLASGTATRAEAQS